MDRTLRCELLAQLPDADLNRLAVPVLDGMSEHIELITPPTVGMVMARVEEGARGEVFNFGEILVTECRVRINSTEGWAMLLGSRPTAALRAASVDAILAADPARGAELDHELQRLAEIQRQQAATERAALDATRVRFETQ
jgi:alpha-D-ribose 1-methylphosphonate 5-triphosphate synthase subunit PhnG